MTIHTDSAEGLQEMPLQKHKTLSKMISFEGHNISPSTLCKSPAWQREKGEGGARRPPGAGVSGGRHIQKDQR